MIILAGMGAGRFYGWIVAAYIAAITAGYTFGLIIRDVKESHLERIAWHTAIIAPSAAMFSYISARNARRNINK